MYSSFRIIIVLALLAPARARAAVLENPSNGNFYSGISVISGWKCEANGPLTVRFFDTNMAPIGDPIPLAYRNERTDTAGVCGDTNNGFVAVWNYANLGRGEATYTAVAYDEGEEFARSTFEVYAFKDSFGEYPDGYEQFMRGAFGTCVAHGFHPDGYRQQFMWNEATQHMEMVDNKPYSEAWHSVFTRIGSGESPECASFGVALDKATHAEAEAEARQKCEEANAVSVSECPSHQCQSDPTWEGIACYAAVACHFDGFAGYLIEVVTSLGRTEEHAFLRALPLCGELAEGKQGTVLGTQLLDTGCPNDD